MQDSLLSDVLYADFVSRVTMHKERKKYSRKIRKSSRALKVTLKKPNNLKIIYKKNMTLKNMSCCISFDQKTQTGF